MGGNIHAITMGPKRAKFALRSALALGVDSAWLISDRAFAGSDVLATSYTLAEGISKVSEPDIIFCGKQSTDGDTGQVGPELAELLKIPHASYVNEILEITDKYITVACHMGSFIDTVKLSLPCLISVERDGFVPRISSFRDKIEAQKRDIGTITLDDFKDKSSEFYGYKGSPTKVRAMYVPKIVRKAEIIDETSDEITDKILEELEKWEVLPLDR